MAVREVQFQGSHQLCLGIQASILGWFTNTHIGMKRMFDIKQTKRKHMVLQSRKNAGGWMLILLLFGVTTEARGVRIRAVIEHLITDSSSSYQQELEKVYVPRNFTPLWVVSDGLTKDGHVLVETLKQADEQGLNPRDYDQSELRWLE